MWPLSFLLVALLTAPPRPEPLPAHALARFGSHRWHHGEGLALCALSPDSRFAASADDSPRVVLWDAATGERLREWRPKRVRDLSFSPDGSQLAVTDIAGVTVLATPSGRVLHRIADDLRWARFATDGRLVLCGLDWVESRDARTLEKQWRTRAPLAKHELVARAFLSPDGKRIAWLTWESDKCGVNLRGGGVEQAPPMNQFGTMLDLLITDSKTGARLLKEKKRFLGTGRLAFTGDGRRFLTGSRLHDTATGRPVGKPLDHRNPWQTALMPDGQRIIVEDGSGEVEVFDARTGKRIRRLLDGLTPLLYRYAVSHDRFCEHQHLSADGRKLLLATRTTLRLIDTETGFENHPPRPRLEPRFSDDGKTLHAHCDEARLAWDAASGRLVSSARLNPWEGAGRHRPLARDKGRVVVSRHGRVSLSEAASGRALSVMKGIEYATWGQFSPDALRLLFWSDVAPASFIAPLHEAGSGKRLGEIDSRSLRGAPAFSPDGRLIAWAESGGKVALFDGTTGKFARHLPPAITSGPLLDARLSFSPDGEQLAVFARQGEWRNPTTAPVVVYRMKEGRIVVRFFHDSERKERTSRINCAGWSPDGRLLAIAESGSIRVVEAATGAERAAFKGHRGPVHSLVFSPEGKTLASGGESDNVVFLWDFHHGDSPRHRWWEELAGSRPGAALASLVRAKDAAFLAERLRPVAHPDRKRVARLIADLDADDFDARQAASRALAELGELAAPALRDARTYASSEKLNRIARLLDAIPLVDARALRGIEALERMATPEARRVLSKLAEGAPEARVTKEAVAALRRLRP